MNNILQNYRNRIATAAIRRLERKTGGHMLVIKLPDNQIETIEIDINFVTNLLLRFEGVARGELGKDYGNTTIINAYQNAVEINRFTEYLTEQGKLLIDELMSEVVDYIKEKHINGGVH